MTMRPNGEVCLIRNLLSAIDISNQRVKRRKTEYDSGRGPENFCIVALEPGDEES
jgi:hypothetical protein